MEPRRCERSHDACGCGDLDLRRPARRGLWWASLLCLAAALAAAQAADHATDDVHRVMFWVLAGGLGVGAFILQAVRIAMRWRSSR